MALPSQADVTSQNYSSQSAAIAEVVSISSDECEITKVIQHSAGNAESQAKDCSALCFAVWKASAHHYIAIQIHPREFAW